jgi:hypothetical protein
VASTRLPTYLPEVHIYKAHHGVSGSAFIDLTLDRFEFGSMLPVDLTERMEVSGGEFRKPDTLLA